MPNSAPLFPLNEEFRTLVARYLNEEIPLEAAATEFAQLWRQWAQLRTPASERRSSAPSPPPGEVVVSAFNDMGSDMTSAQFHRVQALITAAAEKLSALTNGAA